MIKLRTSIKPLTAAVTAAMVFATLSSHAEITEPDAKRVKQDYPLGTMAEWLATPDAYALNPVNIRAGKHPDRSDPNDGPYDVIYIFESEADAEAWWPLSANPAAPMPDGIPDKAVAFVHWELDNGSGTFPGIMSKSDIDGFKSKNCIMAAGAEIPVPGPENPAIEKTCSNPQGSSKRFKMNVLKADANVDLVYNVETAPLTYENYDETDGLPTFDGTEESGRIYRVLQKWHNATATDTTNETRDGVRVGGFSVQLGTGVGGSFQPLANQNDDGLAPDKSLGFELRPCMPDQFFDVKRDRPGTGTNPCSTVQDTTGQDLPQEIWLQEEYSTFSPKMYSYNDDKRTTPVGGFWDKQPGGIEPPAVQTLGFLYSGDALSTDSVYDRIDPSGVASDNQPVFRGATTPNYLSIADNQAAGVTDGPINTNPQSPFGYLMYYGVLSDDSYGEYGDFGNLSQGIYIDEDGDPATEGDLIAWWDGSDYRWGSDPDLNGEIDDNKFTKVPVETLVQWALYPLQEEPDPDTGEFPPGPLFETGLMDDLAGLNVDYFVYLGRQFTGDQFTIRLRAVSTNNAPFAGTTGDDVPPWGTATDLNPNVAPPLDSFVGDDGIIDIKALGFAGDPLLVLLADTGATGLGSLPTVEVENLRTEEVETVTLGQDPTLTWKFTFTLPTAASGDTGASNDGTLNVWPLDFVRVTYVDAFDGTNSNVVKTDQVQIPVETVDPTPPPAGGGDDDSGWCSYNPNGRFDPVLPALILTALGYLGLRRKTASSK